VILTRSTLIFRPLPALMVSAVTAAVIESVFAEGKTMACLYTDFAKPLFKSLLCKDRLQAGLRLRAHPGGCKQNRWYESA
jgi:hypothetical protein